MPTLNDAVRRLHSLLQDRRMLLIVDDVWDADHAQTFRAASPPSCALLFTTRETNVADAIVSADESVFNLPVLTEEHAVELLERLAPDTVASHPAECRELVRDLECLPLSLQVAGRMLRVESKYGWGVEDLLGELRKGTALLNEKAPSDRFDVQNHTLPTVAALLKHSTSRLDEQTRECFAFLGAFAPKPATFDEDAMQAVWEVDDAKPIIRRLVSRGLLEPVGRGRFQMHALLVAYARSLLDE